jgi:hypothetical protein
MNKADINHSRLFFVWYFSGEMFATNYFHGHMLLALYVENVDGVRIVIKATVL